MAWNEPGGKNRDPWGQRHNDGPPDLDEVFRKLRRKIGGIFGARGGGGGHDNGGGLFNLGLIGLGLLLLWLIWGSYLIDEQERGVVLQFGRHVDTRMPGYNFAFVPFQKMLKVNLSSFRSIPDRAQVLTGDENIVDLEYAVQYNVKDAAAYVFNVKDPDLTVRQSAESAIREVTGKNTMDYVITDGRSEIAAKVKELLQEILDRYEAGINIITLNLTKAQPPQDVRGAFADAIKAREDEQRYINEAEAYSNEIIPLARGNAAQMVEAAKAYKVRVVKSAEGEAQRFLALLAEYREAPHVTRERLYIDTMEAVLGNSSKVMLDVEGGNNLLYLPLDQLLKHEPGRVTVEPLSTDSRMQAEDEQVLPSRERDRQRLREIR